MRTASQALIDLLNSSQQFVMADLLTIALRSGQVLRYTSADIPLSHGGRDFVPFAFRRGNTRLVVGVEVDTLDISLYASVGDLINGLPAPRFAQNGGFDGANVLLERAFLSDWSEPIVGVLHMFSGRVSEVSPTSTEIRLLVKSDLELLDIKMPRNLYQPRCSHNLYDSGCGVNKASYAVNSTVAAGSTRTDIKCGLTQTAGYFALGVVLFRSGANAGATRTVKSYAQGIITLSLPLAYDPAVGDAFTVWPGCDKTLLTCQSKFNNKQRFRGFPYVPVPETAY